MAVQAQHPGRKAAEAAVGKRGVQIKACGATPRLPGSDQLAFFAGVDALAHLGLVEWPVAGVLTLGHALVKSRSSAMVREFGDALEQV